MDRGISLQVNDDSKERVSRCWRIHSRSICGMTARYCSKGFLTVTIEWDPTT